jgi:hypothetical protein
MIRDWSGCLSICKMIIEGTALKTDCFYIGANLQTPDFLAGRFIIVILRNKCACVRVRVDRNARERDMTDGIRLSQQGRGALLAVSGTHFC